MLVDQKGVLIGANKQSHVLDFDQDGRLAAYGAGTTVAIWDPLAPSQKGVYQTLNGHTKEVTCVRFLRVFGWLASASEDGKICVWGRHREADSFSLRCSNDETTHAITTLCAVGNMKVLAGDSGGVITLWLVGASNLERISSFSVKKNFYPTCLSVQQIGNRYILVVGGTSSDLFVYTFNYAGDFEQCAVLPGHEDWITSLALVEDISTAFARWASVTDPQYEEYSSSESVDSAFFENDCPLEFILASGSQDRYIRLWRLRMNGAIDDSDEDGSKLVLLSNKQYKFPFGHGRASFSFESLIMGHDDWVTGLQWIPASPSRKLQLLSLSADTALIVWEMDEESGIWVTASRLGELSIKGASTATGSSGGFWSCAWFESGDSQSILASGRTGAIRAYKSEQRNSWEPVLGVTGAVLEITDLVWSKDGTYILSTSLDQTTRLIAPWTHCRGDGDATQRTWHEFARPQIHGYDMMCIDNVTSTMFVSGGDEKILRVFEMTQAIHKLLCKFCGIEPRFNALPESASLPVLGLSNKAANEQLEAGEAQQREEDHEAQAESKPKETGDILDELQGPPLEDFLQRHTLFPEVEKLYGHGYEITCCATSPDQALIASACRSNSARHSVIRLFNVQKDFQLMDQVLKGHNYTITSMEFSPDGRFLLAVSRDRQYSLWRVMQGDPFEFELVELNAKAHKRIVWDCSWAPCMNGRSEVFVTGSRDGTLKAWSVGSGPPVLTDSFKAMEPVTSVACFQEELIDESVIVAMGLESGKISICSLEPQLGKLLKVEDFAPDVLPALRVAKLAFSKKRVGSSLQLAVGSTDRSVRIYHLDVSTPTKQQG